MTVVMLGSDRVEILPFIEWSCKSEDTNATISINILQETLPVRQ